MDVGGVPAMVNRISYTGDLGYEIWVEPAYLRTLYRAIKAAGAAHGHRRFRHAGAAVDAAGEELADLVRRAPADLRAVRGRHGALRAARQADFIGRDAAAREAEAGPRLRRVCLVIDAEDADVMGDEPIWARVNGRDFGAVAPAARLRRAALRRRRRRGSRRRQARRRARRDGDWRVVGWVTSGGYGHSVGCRWRRATCRRRWPSDESEGLFEVEILGVRRAGAHRVEPPFDPTGEKMRS